jgi:hypothetical protein
MDDVASIRVVGASHVARGLVRPRVNDFRGGGGNESFCHADTQNSGEIPLTVLGGGGNEKNRRLRQEELQQIPAEIRQLILPKSTTLEACWRRRESYPQPAKVSARVENCKLRQLGSRHA